MRKLWIVTELFYPDETSTSYILSNIANALVDKYEVNVISSSNLYQKNKELTNDSFLLDERINIIKTSNKEFDKNNLLQRTFRIISLTIDLSLVLWAKVKKDDKVFIVTNPAPLLIVLSIMKKIRNFEFCILVHDVFPENTIPARIIKTKSSLIYRLMKPIFNWAYSSADTLVVLGRDMKEIFINKLSHYKKIPNIEIIENWGDIITIKPLLENTDRLNKLHLRNKVVIQYAGNIGRTQGLQEFLVILRGLNNKNIHFDLWGDGAMKNELIKFVSENNMSERISFNGLYSRSEQRDILNSTDISLITLADGMYGLGVPSKAYNILASGKPILFIGHLNSEIALMIREENVGFCFEPNDTLSIAKFLNDISLTDLDNLKAMGTKARKLAENKYSEEIILNKFMSKI